MPRRSKETSAQVATHPDPAWAVDPRRLPDLRTSMCEQMRNPWQHDELAMHLKEGAGTIVPTASSHVEQAALLLADEWTRLTSARLWSVSAELTDISVAAGARLPTWPVRRSDLPNLQPGAVSAPSGLVVYDKPIARYVNRAGWPVLIVAASWGPTQLINEDDCLWITFWSVVDRSMHVEDTLIDRPDLKRSFVEETVNRVKLADLNWDNEVVAFYDSPFVRSDTKEITLVDPAVDSGVRSNETTLNWVQIVRATWMLLRKDNNNAKIVETEEMPQPKTARRRSARVGVQDASPVTVAHVHSSRRPRRPAAEDLPAGEGRKVSVRFPVSGHIRWQPYPSTGEIKPIWIAPHERGPEGAPYVVGKNVTVHRLDSLPE